MGAERWVAVGGFAEGRCMGLIFGGSGEGGLVCIFLGCGVVLSFCLC